MKEEIMESFLSYGSKKVKKESLEEFLNSYKKEDLIRLAILPLVMDDNLNLNEIYNIKSSKKQEIIDYIKNNKESIIMANLGVIDDIIRKDLRKITKNIDEEKYLQDDYNLKTIMYLRQQYLAKVEYNSTTGEVKIFIPKEFNDLILQLINDRVLIKKAKKMNDLIDYVNLVTDVYGMISLKEFHKMYERHNQKIDYKKLQNSLINASFINENIRFITTQEEGRILYGIGIGDEDDAYTFYYSRIGEYKDYTKKQLLEVHNFLYLKKQKEYQDFRKYLIDTYEVDEDEANEITEFLASDFMYSSQIDEEVAVENFKTNFKKYFVTNDSGVSKFLLPTLQKLFEKYPKWYKKGNK